VAAEREWLEAIESRFEPVPCVLPMVLDVEASRPCPRVYWGAVGGKCELEKGKVVGAFRFAPRGASASSDRSESSIGLAAGGGAL